MIKPSSNDFLIALIIFSVVCIAVILGIYYFPPKIQRNYASITPISSIKHKFETGDLIFFSGDNFASKLVRCATKSPWSHAAMIIIGNDETPFLWECDRGQGIQSGSRIISLSKKLSRYRGDKIGAWMKLFYIDLDLCRLRKFIMANLDVKLQSSVNPYILSLFGKGEDPASKTWYCSELLSRTYKAIGALPNKVNSCTVTPSDFFNNSLEFRKGFSLSKPTIFKF